MEHRNNVHLSLFIHLAKVQQNQCKEYQRMDPEYVYNWEN